MDAEKYQNSPRKIDLKAICLNASFGDLKFQKALPLLEKMRTDITELEDLDYKEYLTQQEINRIESSKNNLNGYIQQIQNFSLSQGNPQQIRDNLESQIQNYYNNSFANETRSSLIYLRQEAKLDVKTEKELQSTIANAKKLEKELQDKLQKINKDEESIEKGSGIVSSKFLSQEFEEQFKVHGEEADKWYRYSTGFYIALGMVIISSFLVYFLLIRGTSDRSLMVEWAAFSLLLISVIYFGLKFFVSNYNIHRNSELINRHRRNVAETLVRYLESDKSSETLKTILIKDASSAMFEHQSTGYLDKDQMQISSPVKEMVTKIITDKV